MSAMQTTPPTPPAAPSTETSPTYPATLTVDYPDRPLNRLTTFFRIFTTIPIAIVLAALTSLSFPGRQNYEFARGMFAQGQAGVVSIAGVLFLAVLLMILFRKKYPKWWYDWNLGITRFCYRVTAYLALLRDEYPSTDDEQAVHLNFAYPDARTELRRGMPLVKWLLAIPHWVILCFLFIAAWVCVIIAWFAILFTGRYPRGLFGFVVGVGRWTLRVEAYALLLVTDRYPPFSLQP